MNDFIVKFVFQPLAISIDFEVAAFNAIHRHFPGAQLFGCLYHLTKNARKKLASVPGSIQRYQEDPEFAHHCRCVIAVAFVPINDVDRALTVLEQNLPRDVKFLLDWFEEYYVGMSNCLIILAYMR